MISIPYTVYAEIFPVGVKRVEQIRSLESISKKITTDLNDNDFVITESNVSATPQFAQYPARVTIIGFDNVNIDNFQPADPITVDAPYTSPDDNFISGNGGKTVSGYMGTSFLHPGQGLDPKVRVRMLNLKSALEAASSLLDHIYRIDYMGIVFGKGGYSFQ